MTGKSDSFITVSQMACILILTTLGSETLYIPSIMVRIAGQSSWIYEIVGVMYPLYIVLIAVTLNKKCPQDNILTLSKKYFGKILGGAVNFLFLVQFIFYTAIRFAELHNLIRVHIVYFLTPQIIIALAAATAAYSSSKDLKTLSRMNEVTFWFCLGMALVPLGAMKYGKASNLMPLFDIDTTNIAEGLIAGTYNYYGFEIFLLLYPYMKDKNKIAKAGTIGSVGSGAVLVWLTVTSIYYLGIDLVPKYLWPVIATTKAVGMIVIKNFTFIFLFFIVIAILTNIVNNYYAAALILHDSFNRISIQTFSLILAPAVFYISNKLGNETITRDIACRAGPCFTGYNILFTSAVAVITFAKKRKVKKSA